MFLDTLSDAHDSYNVGNCKRRNRSRVDDLFLTRMGILIFLVGWASQSYGL